MTIKATSALLFSTALLTGCVTMPAPTGQASSAHKVGDRSSLPLGEQVFTIHLTDGPTGELRNLHVRLEVLINPRTVSWTSGYDVDGIIRRLEPRIGARLSDYLPIGKSIPLSAIAGLKDEIVREAQGTLLASYTKWKSAGDYEVQVVATGFYLTDLSVGTPVLPARGWW